MRPEDVVDWREALIRLSDQHFFDLMRMYLGAIKTPFNKQRLIEELSSFLRKKENRERIVLCLDEFDRMILAAIGELPSPTQQKIVALFNGCRAFPEVYERILNLEERLLIYRKSDAESREYAINPMLAESLRPYVSRSILASPEAVGPAVLSPLPVNDLTLAALYSFFLHEGDAVKNDGSIRKKTLAALGAVFPQLSAQSGCLELLLAAFQNLSLLVKNEGRLVPDPGRWEAFARADPLSRVAWLVAAAPARISRDALRDRAQAFLDFFASLESGARYRLEMVGRLAFLLSERSARPGSSRLSGRFSAMIREQDDAPSQGVAASPQGLVPIVRAFGLLVEDGGLFARNSAFAPASAGAGHAARAYLIVSPSLSVTLMPGFSLGELLPIAACMEVRDVQIACQFEITRRSCAIAFDQGFTAERLIGDLRAHSAQGLPQNVEFTIRDWFASYSAVSLYHGYVLRVDESRRVLFENDEYLSALIRKILAPGVYLLDAETPEDIQGVFSRADIDFLPSVSSPAPRRESVDLPALAVFPASRDPLAAPSVSPPRAADPGACDALRAELLASLEALALPDDLRDALRSRIDRRIALSPAQLDPDSVRVEKVEARGMDFLGKVRIAEYALAAGSLLEIVCDEKDGSRQMIGRPISTEKRTGDVLLRLAIEPDQGIEQVSLGRAVLVRRIRGSIFSELPQIRT